VLVLLVLLCLGAAGWTAGADEGATRGTDHPIRTAEETGPNIIVFLADDMASYQLQHMPHTRTLVFDRGARFTNFHANVPLCCPSRASLLTGKYAHNTGIEGNSYPDGFFGFHSNDESSSTVAIALRRRAGYSTGLLGKYLNEYPYVDSSPRNGVPATFVPPGWSDWAVPVRGQFAGTDYRLNLNGRIVRRQAPRDYLGDLLVRRAVRKIEGNRDRSGLALLLSFHGPHVPEPASPIEKEDERLVERISRIHFPRTPDFDEADVSDKPLHIRSLPRLTRAQKAEIDRVYRRQLLSLASIDRYVREVVRALRRTGQLDNTYLAFTSDHGYHLGSHRLLAGKNTPYHTDVRVPFGLRGPGIAPGTVVRDVVGTIDVAPTLADIAGIELPYTHDGESVLPLARGSRPEAWRRYFLIRRGHIGGPSQNVTAEPARRAERTSARAIRGWRGVVAQRWQYVRHQSGEEEMYDRLDDPHQVRNVLARPLAEQTPEQRQAAEDLRAALDRLTGCAGVEDCRVQ
jgi:arylsulfatase A-like enzyme